MITTKTQTGTEVRLTGVEYMGSPLVEVSLTHPKVGAVFFRADTYGETQGKGGVGGYTSKGRVFVTVPREDFDRAMADARAIGERELAELKDGTRKIELYWSDGEYLSGYAVRTGVRAARLLVELGLAEQVSGWGTHVRREVAETLGESFTYAQAAEYARPALEAKQRKRECVEAARAEKFALARRTGKPVVLEQWTEDCDGSVDECSTDCVCVYALPDGSKREERTHTY